MNRIIRILVNLLGIAAVLMYGSVSIASNIFSSPGAVLQSFCNEPSPRQTLLYLDQGIIGKTDTDWYRDLQNKLKFLPSERIKVMMFSSEDSRVKDIWSTCYPSYTAKVYQEKKDNAGPFSAGPDKLLKEAGKLYNNLFIKALAVPVEKTVLPEKPHYEVGEFPKKSILEAIYYDSGRFDLDNGTTRVVVFSDMVENSSHAAPDSLQDIENAKTLAREAADRYPLDLNNAQFYVYGVGYSHKSSILNRQLKTFWSYWLNRSGAYLQSFETQLNMPKREVGFDPVSYVGALEQLNGVKIATNLRLGFSENGKLANSWIGIRNMRFPIDGSYNRKGSKYSLKAKVVFGDEDYQLFLEDDVLLIAGSMDELKGTIGAEDDSTRTPDGKKFSLKVAFDRDAQLQF